MEQVQVGDVVCWAKEKRTVTKYSAKGLEYFIVQNVRANGRCDLRHLAGGELFNIPLTDLELVRRPK